ncbi:hypothetical protein EC991_006890 [Linnemannia zychae]|nr:hypothetical protein EC991_006890 [Linnemannia zychae]
MSLSSVRKMRAWVLFLTTVSFALVITLYVLLVSTYDNSKTFSLKSPHYLEIFASGFLFFAYMYSLWCNLYTLPKIVRAIIMSFLAIVLLVAEFMFLVDKIKGTNKTIHIPPLSPPAAGTDNSNPFLCGPTADTACYVENSNQFVSIITGFFVLAEVVVTMVVKEKKKEVVYVYGDDDDDSDGGSVIVMF